MTTALITGISGQDGSYLAELLLGKGYEVYGLSRGGKDLSKTPLAAILPEIHVLSGDLSDQASLDTAVEDSRPDEVYNLAAQPFVAASWEKPVLTADVDALGALRLLESVRRHRTGARVFQAGSSEIFDRFAPSPQDESTPLRPYSPYGVAKLFAYWTAATYRESHGMFCSNGILFNHESPRRGIEFVTRKITDGVARIACGIETELRLGNLDAVRDWGYAGDFVQAMWMMLQQDEPDDYVIATGEAHSVREFVEQSFREAGLDWKDHVVIDPRFFRPAEAWVFLGNPVKARERLGWQARVSFPELVRMMVRADIERYMEGKRP